MTCQWFYLCNRPAAGTVKHPVLDPVPTCARCARALDLKIDLIARAGR